MSDREAYFVKNSPRLVAIYRDSSKQVSTSHLTDRELYLWNLTENKHRYDQLPWQWDYNYEPEMFGIWYEEDFNCYKEICDLILEGSKNKKTKHMEWPT